MILLLLLLACPPAPAPPVHVHDGDTLTVGTTKIRLHAVDAPELAQTCTRHDGTTWPCGQAAADRLKALATTPSCTPKDTDPYGRTVAVCTVGGMDLGETLIREGLALAYRRFGTAYVPAEDEARAARRGIWSGDFTAPHEYRRENPRR